MKTNCLLLRFCLLGSLLLLPAVTQAQLTFTTNNDAITITGYTGSGGAVVIPDSTNGYPVSAIADYAFYGNSTLTNLTIPSSVTNIGVFEFQACSGLTNVTVAGANPNYASAGGVLFDKAMTTLLQCPGGLAGSYTIPNGVTSIADDAFEYCSRLSGVTIPGSVTSIGIWAFFSSGLSSATIPGSVTNIGYLAFAGFGPLTNITVDGDNLNYASAGGILFNKAMTTLVQCPPLLTGSYTIPSSVTNIGDYAFIYSSLSSVTIPNSVIGIGVESFWNDGNLTTVAIPDSVASIGYDAFYACYGLKSVTLGSGVASIGYWAFADCSALTNFTVAVANPNYASAGGVLFDKAMTALIQCPGGLAGSYMIPNTVTNIGFYAFIDCYNLTNVTIGSSVISISESAFYVCSRLTSVSIPNNVRSIGWQAFDGCYGLTNVTIGSGVADIGGNAFAGCSALTTVTIPASVTSMGGSCFAGCAKLTQAYFQGDAPLVDGWEAGSADTSVFSGETGTVYYVPGTAGWDTSFGGWSTVAFVPFAYTYITNIDNTITITGCTGAGGDITIPDRINGLTVASIGAGAFQHNSSLTNITIPASVISLGSLAFSDCTNLTEIYFLGNAPTADLTVFSGDNHAIVYYPQGATGWSSPFDGLLAAQQNPPAPAGDFYYTTFNGAVTILDYYGAGGDIGIPSTIAGLPVVGIGNGVFEYNDSLTSVTIPNSVTNIGVYAFFNCGNLTSVTIGNGVTSIGYSAFDYCYNLTNVMIGKSVTSIGDWAFEDSGSPLTVVCLGNAPQADSTVFNGDDPVTIYYLPDSTGWDVPFAGITAVLWTAPVPPVTLTYTYTTNYDGTITITGYTGAGGDVTIPDMIDGLTVTRIGAGAFQHNSSLTRITIPASVINLGSLAFSDCTNLTGIYFLGNAPSADLTVFAGDNHAIVYYPPGATGWSSPFYGLLAGQQNPPSPAGDFSYDTINGAIIITGYYGAGGDIGIPSTINGLPVVGIGEDAFDSYGSLTSVTIPNSVTNIGEYAFDYCYNLTSVTIGNGVTSIGFAAFNECESLINVMIGKSVTQIGDWAFEDSGSPLTVVCLGNAPNADGTVFAGDNPVTIYYLPDTTGWDVPFAGLTAVLWTAPVPPVPLTYTYITNSDNTITITGCTGGGGDVTIWDIINGLTVTGIANGAFQHNSSLTSITIPAGITNLGSAAFADCTNLTGIYFLGNAPSPDVTVFAGDNRATIYYPPGATGWSSPFDGLLAEVQNPVAPAGDFTYTTINGAIIITGYTGAGGAIGIPRTIAGLPVVGIGDGAFEDSSLTSVTIPSSVTNIGNYAFDYCYNLTSIMLGNNVTSLGYDEFYGCSGLTNVTIGNNVANIGNNAFYDCDSLTAFTVAALNSSYSSVDGVLFNQGQTLLIQFPAGKAGSYIIPDSVTDIGDWAFEECYGLTHVTMGNNILHIGYGAFADCYGLKTTVVIPNSVNSIGGSAFYNCQSLTNVTIGNSVASIGDSAFADCRSLTNIVIPASVWSIGDYVFNACSSLTAITVDPANLYFCSPNGVLFNKSQTTLLEYPAGKAGSYIIPDSVTSIGDGAFNNCTNLTSLTIDNNVPSIGDYEFYGDSSLASVTIGNGVTSLGYEAFAYCTSLARVTIPGHVTSIGSEAFSFCTSLTNVMISASVTNIGNYVFYSCTSLIAIKVDPSNPVFSSLNGVLFNVGQTTLIQFPGGVGGSYTIPGTVTNIADTAFYYCQNLASVTIPDHVLSIGVTAFSSCNSLTNVTIGNGVTSIGDQAFMWCNNLTNLIIGNSVTNIGEEAFEGCTSLTSVTFPASVASIGAYAFYYCTSLTGAYFEGNAPSGGDSYVFYYDSLATVYDLPVTGGWTSWFGTRPVVQWNLPPQISLAGLGMQMNQFGFNLTGYSGQVVVVEACTDLASPVWLPVQTNTLTTGSAYFSDPQWTNYPGRYYRLRSP